MNVKEVWRDIPGYEGYYQASNLGRVRSLDRTILTTNGQERFYKGKIKKGSVNNKGYTQYSLNINGIGRNFMRSQIISMTFLGHEPNGHKLVVDHIDGDISDDRVENLRIVTQRANTSTCFRSDEDSLSSEYAGVYWNKNTSKWMARIYHEGVRLYLGLYNTEVEASNSYQSALSKIKDGSFNPNDYKPEFSSQYKGVVFDKNRGKWMARITVNGKKKHLGRFNTEIEAHNAYQKALKEKKDGSTL